MKKSLAIVAAAALASTAGAQSMEIEPGDARVFQGEVVRVTVFGDCGPADYAIAGIEFRVDATGGAWADHRHHISISQAPPPAQNPGTIVGSSVIGIRLGQALSFSYTPEPGRIRLWSADFSSAAAGVFDITTTTSRMEVYTENEPPGGPWPRRLVTPTEGAARVTVIPAPASLAVLGLGALAAARRRRSSLPGVDRERRDSMKKSVAIFVAVGVASAAGAQSLEFEPGTAVVAPGESVTLTVFGDPGPADHVIAGVEFQVDATGGAWANNQHHISPSQGPASAQNSGTIDGSSVTGILVHQLDPAFGYEPLPGRIRLWSADFSSAAEGVFDISTTTSRMEVYDVMPPFAPWLRRAVTPTEGFSQVTVIPAPAGVALLGLGGLAVGRRRRGSTSAATSVAPGGVDDIFVRRGR